MLFTKFCLCIVSLEWAYLQGLKRSALANLFVGNSGIQLRKLLFRTTIYLTLFEIKGWIILKNTPVCTILQEVHWFGNTCTPPYFRREKCVMFLTRASLAKINNLYLFVYNIQYNIFNFSFFIPTFPTEIWKVILLHNDRLKKGAEPCWSQSLLCLPSG